MKTFKEFPATHSMSTAWYFVDEDENVAIFGIEDNGPVPAKAGGSQNAITDLCFYDPIEEIDGMKHLNLTDEQVLDLFENQWKTEVAEDEYWSTDYFMIDAAKENEFFQYLSEIQKRRTNDDEFIPVCLSRKYGIYGLNLDSYKYGNGLNNPFACYLFENKIVLKYAREPYFDWLEDDEQDIVNNSPYFLYQNDWDSSIPHHRVCIPKHPVKLSQLPERLQRKVIKLNVKFAETENIHIAEKILCYSSSWMLETEEGYLYSRVIMPSGEKVFVLISAATTKSKIKEKDILDRWNSPARILTKEQVDKLLELEVNKYCRNYD